MSHLSTQVILNFCIPFGEGIIYAFDTNFGLKVLRVIETPSERMKLKWVWSQTYWKYIGTLIISMLSRRNLQKWKTSMFWHLNFRAKCQQKVISLHTVYHTFRHGIRWVPARHWSINVDQEFNPIFLLASCGALLIVTVIALAPQSCVAKSKAKSWPHMNAPTCNISLTTNRPQL